MYLALRDGLVVMAFVLSMMFFLPDVVGMLPLPITGSLAAACAFAVLLLKLVTRGDADERAFHPGAPPAGRAGDRRASRADGMIAA